MRTSAVLNAFSRSRPAPAWKRRLGMTTQLRTIESGSNDAVPMGEQAWEEMHYTGTTYSVPAAGSRTSE